jgi:hypothetical protein
VSLQLIISWPAQLITIAVVTAPRLPSIQFWFIYFMNEQRPTDEHRYP